MPLLNKFLHTIYISIIRGIPLILFVVVLLSLSISIIPQGGYSHLTSFLFGMLKTFWLGIVLAIISFNKIWLRIIWLVVTLLITIIYLCLGLKFSVTFTPYVAQLILQTNTAETNEFFGIYIGFKFIIFLSLFFLINLFLYCSSEKLWLKYLRKRKSKYNANFKTSFFIIICLLFPISTITNFTNLASLDLGNKNRNILRRFFFFHKAPYLELWYSFSAGKDNNNNIELIEKGYQELKIDSIKSITPPHICLIIGDSFIKSHSNLYGYRLITNPNLTKENKNGNLIVFNDVISKFSVTRRSVPSILMLENGDCGFSWNKFTNDYDSLKKITLLPSVLKKAGYSVFFLDNQATSIYNEKEFSISYLLT